MGQPGTVSVVVLTFNSADYIGPCLASLAAQTQRDIELVIVDNASSDSTLERTRSAASKHGLSPRIVALGANAGCAGGNNEGWRAARGSIVVFLNPDTEAAPGFVAELVAPLQGRHDEVPLVGITGARILYPGTRTLQHAGGTIMPNGMTNHIGAGETDEGQYSEARDVDYVTGAGFAVRRDLLEQLGGFDEDYYPAYFEEVDLCTRARRLGRRVQYVPSALLYHHESVSLEADSPAFRRLYQRMRIRYCLKNFGVRWWLRRAGPSRR